MSRTPTLEQAIRRLVSEGKDPRSFCQGLADIYTVDSEAVDAEIGKIAIPDPSDLDAVADARRREMAYAHPDSYRGMYDGLDHCEDD